MGKETKPSWCPDTASKAYLDTVRIVTPGGLPAETAGLDEPNVADLVAALAAGSGARLIVEAWARGDGAATSVGLAVARRHTGGRHVCVVPDERTRAEYAAVLAGVGVVGESAAEVVVGEVDEVVGAMGAADFVVADCRRRDWVKVFRHANVGPRGAVMVCKGAGPRGVRWRGVLGGGVRVVRMAFLPVGKGVEIAQVVPGGGCGGGGTGGGRSRWIKHVDRCTGEEHVFRR